MKRTDTVTIYIRLKRSKRGFGIFEVFQQAQKIGDGTAFLLGRWQEFNAPALPDCGEFVIADVVARQGIGVVGVYFVPLREISFLAPRAFKALFYFLHCSPIGTTEPQPILNAHQHFFPILPLNCPGLSKQFIVIS